MENRENKNTCRKCNKYFDILVSGLCIECFEKNEIIKKRDNPLDKFEFEKDEFEEIQNEYIKKDIEKKNKDGIVVHNRPNLDRAIDKIIKISKSKKK